MSNRIENNWSDEARAASLRVRQEKAARREAAASGGQVYQSGPSATEKAAEKARQDRARHEQRIHDRVVSDPASYGLYGRDGQDGDKIDAVVEREMEKYDERTAKADERKQMSPQERRAAEERDRQESRTRDRIISDPASYGLFGRDGKDREKIEAAVKREMEKYDNSSRIKNNLIGNNWSDEARDASLRVRRERAAERRGMSVEEYQSATPAQRRAAIRAAGTTDGPVQAATQQAQSRPATPRPAPETSNIRDAAENGTEALTDQQYNELVSDLRTVLERADDNTPISSEAEAALIELIADGYAGQNDSDPVFEWMEQASQDPDIGPRITEAIERRSQTAPTWRPDAGEAPHTDIRSPGEREPSPDDPDVVRILPVPVDDPDVVHTQPYDPSREQDYSAEMAREEIERDKERRRMAKR